jgi:hypothetical protein
MKQTTIAMATETTTFPSQSGSAPGFLHINAKKVNRGLAALD